MTQSIEEVWKATHKEYELVIRALEDGAELAHDDCECPTTVALLHHGPLCRTLRHGLQIDPPGHRRHMDAARVGFLAVLEEARNVMLHDLTHGGTGAMDDLRRRIEELGR